MEYTDLLTIAMPCYERKEYFLEALESALNQTVKCKIIVVDNNSSHSYFEDICNEKGVKYYKNETNIGLYRNINRCFELAETEYVKILDDDDILCPLYVESFLKAKKQYPDIDIFYSNYTELTSEGDRHRGIILPYGYLKNGYKIIEYGILNNLGFPYLTSAIKKTKIHKLDNSAEIIGGFDWEWIYSVADELTFYGDSAILYKFRIHGNQIHVKEWLAHVITVPYIYDVIIREKVSDPELKKHIEKKILFNFIIIKSNINQNELKDFLKNDSRYSKYLKDKLEQNTLIRNVFRLPKYFVQLIALIIRVNNFINRVIKNNLKKS